MQWQPSSRQSLRNTSAHHFQKEDHGAAAEFLTPTPTDESLLKAPGLQGDGSLEAGTREMLLTPVVTYYEVGSFIVFLGIPHVVATALSHLVVIYLQCKALLVISMRMMRREWLYAQPAQTHVLYAALDSEAEMNATSCSSVAWTKRSACSGPLKRHCRTCNRCGR